MQRRAICGWSHERHNNSYDKNLDPVDTEDMVGKCYLDLKPGSIAAFANEDEEIIVLAKVRQSLHRKEIIFDELVSKIHSIYKIKLDTVVFLKEGTLEKTTSGKLMCSFYQKIWNIGLMEKNSLDTLVGANY